MEISFVFRSQSNTSEKPAVSRNRKLNSLRSFRSNAGFQPSLTSAAHKTDFPFFTYPLCLLYLYYKVVVAFGKGIGKFLLGCRKDFYVAVGA